MPEPGAVSSNRMEFEGEAANASKRQPANARQPAKGRLRRQAFTNRHVARVRDPGSVLRAFTQE